MIRGSQIHDSTHSRLESSMNQSKIHSSLTLDVVFCVKIIDDQSFIRHSLHFSFTFRTIIIHFFQQTESMTNTRSLPKNPACCTYYIISFSEKIAEKLLSRTGMLTLERAPKTMKESTYWILPLKEKCLTVLHVGAYGAFPQVHSTSSLLERRHYLYCTSAEHRVEMPVFIACRQPNSSLITENDQFFG
jgi:hypothetical protein